MRAAHKRGISIRWIAEHAGVSKSQVHRILSSEFGRYARVVKEPTPTLAQLKKEPPAGGS